MNCQHCLRPEFTKLVAHHFLQERRSMNLIGKPGHGRERLLQDIMRLADEHTLLLYVDLAQYRYRFSSMIGELHRQCPSTGKPPKNISELASCLPLQERRVALLFHNFDVILNNPEADDKYDVEFLDTLNSLKQGGCPLLCVTKRGYKKYIVETKAKVRRVSVLQLKPVTIRPLIREQVLNDVYRRFNGFSSEESAQIARRVHSHKTPIRLLDHIELAVIDGEASQLPFASRLNDWEKDLSSTDHGVAPSDVHRWTVVARAWFMSTGLHQVGLSFSALLRRLTAWLPKGD